MPVVGTDKHWADRFAIGMDVRREGRSASRKTIVEAEQNPMT
jgi:hypothetical protein